MDSSVTTWNSVASRLAHDHPFLRRLHVRSPNTGAEPIPQLIQIMGVGAYGMLSSVDPVPLVTVVPRLPSFAFWVALISSLAAMRDDFENAVANPPSFNPGNLLLDGERVVGFEYEEDGRLYFSMSKGSSTSSIRKDQWLRLQPTTSERSSDGARWVPREPPPDMLDDLLGIRSYRNRHIFKNRLILVGAVNRHERMLHTQLGINGASGKAAVTVRELIKCGKLNRYGEVESVSPGQLDCEPTLLLASDLTSVREYVRTAGISPLVVLSKAEAWKHRTEPLSSVRAAGGRLMFCLEHHEEPAIPTSWEVDVWEWNPDDLASLSNSRPHKPNGVFSALEATVDRYVRRTITVESCSDTMIESAFEQLSALEREIRSDETVQLQRSLFDFFLMAARACCPVLATDETQAAFERRFERVRCMVNECRWALTKSITSSLDTLCLHYIELIERRDTHRDGKVASLERLLRTSYPKTVAVITAGSWETLSARQYFEERLRLEADRVQFRDFAELDQIEPVDLLVVCGWLNSARMQRILNACIAPTIELLLYPFEAEWYRSSERSRRRAQLAPASSSRRATLLRLNESDLPARPSPAAAAVEATDSKAGAPTIGDFEITLRIRAVCRGADSGEPREDLTDAYPVLFADGYYAYLTPTHEVPVATDFILGEAGETDELPTRSANELVAGDYIIFRVGMQADLIRDTADVALRRQGNLRLRDTAAIWRDALQAFRQSQEALWPDARDPRAVKKTIAALRAGGLRRTDATLRWWLDEHNTTIGPLDEEDIDRIAKVTGYHGLIGRVNEVRSAVKTLRNAHRQAGAYLLRYMFAALRSRITDQSPSPTMYFEIEGLGQAVVTQVELVDLATQLVSYTKVNRLLSEEQT